MGASGMWVIAAIREEHVAQFAPDFHAAVARHAARPDLQAAWQAWRENPELVPGRFPGRDADDPNLLLADPAVAAFDALASDMPWEDPEAAGLEHRSTAACDPTIENLVVLVRKDSPVAALFHGIGPARAVLLPGWFGNFLLTPAEAVALRPQVEAALTFPADEHVRVLQRVRDWLNGMGDSGDKGAEELLTGPLRCWRGAVEAGMGLCATQTWV